MDRLFKIIFAGLILLCPGCKVVHPGHEEANKYVIDQLKEVVNRGCYRDQGGQTVICDTMRGYTYVQPDWITKTDWKKRNVNISTFDFPLSNEEIEEWKTYGHYLPAKASCSPLLTGSSTMSALPSERGKILWGQIDGRTGKVHGSYPDALCKRPSPTNCPRELWETADCDDLTSGYALCAEHDGKTVVVCISQMTDDRAMAEKIFSTFRWLP